MFKGFEYKFKGSELKFKAYEHNFLHGKDTILLGYKQISIAFISFITIINTTNLTGRACRLRSLLAPSPKTSTYR